MTRSLTFILASLLLGLAAPAAAQNNAAPANVVTPAPAPREGTVGPEQLRDFALPGTRQTAPPAATEAPRASPAPTTRAAPPSTTATRPATDAPARAAAEALRPVTAPSDTERAASSESPSPQAPATAPAPPLPSTLLPSATPALPVAAAPLPPIAISQPGGDTSAPLLTLWWPWLLVAALAGVGLALVVRRRRRPVLAGHADDRFERAAPEPAARPRAPAPAPAPPPAPPVEELPQAPLPTGLVTTRLRPPLGAPPPVAPPAAVPAAVSGGIVSTRLRGWIDLDLVVREILFTPGEALLRFDIIIANTGTGTAREIALEAFATNGGEDQAAALSGFFARPAATSVAVPELGRLAETVLSHELVIPRSAILAYEGQGKALFVPVIALSAAYRTGSGEGRTGAAFLIGRDVPSSEKLAPVLLPEADGRLLGLGVRRLQEAVRR